MLKALSIKNYTLIDNLSINFDNGFTVITGETGAGKSVILGAIAMILGKRAETGIIKDKNKKCIIEGEFDLTAMNLEGFFSENDLDFDNISYLRREILPSGKSRAFINDTPVNLNTLKELGNKLVDIHSQHQTLLLGNTSFQLETLDNFLGINDEVKEYGKIFKEYKTLQKKLEELKEKEAVSKRDEDYLRFQLEELEKINLDTGSFKENEERMNFLTHAEEVTGVLNETTSELLTGETNVLDKIAYLKDRLFSISGFLSAAGEYAQRLDTVWLELKDIAEEAEKKLADSEFDPLEMQHLEEVINSVYRLMQKHRVNDIEELLALRDEFKEKLSGIDNLEELINDTDKKLKEITSILEQKAKVLSGIRKKGSTEFSEAVKNILKNLGMKNASFEVKIENTDEFTGKGKDKVFFLFSANKGLEPGEISKIASGGELSRLMLAIKSLITESSMLPTVIFDEIDSGVSGDIAEKVGNILKSMSENHQVIAITHLPQIAAKADNHFKVYKETVDNDTKTKLKKLDNDSRLEEIASLFSGETVTRAAKEAAKELLN